MGIRSKLSVEAGLLIFLSFFVAGIFLFIFAPKYLLQETKLKCRDTAKAQTFKAANSALKKEYPALEKIINEISEDPAVYWAGYQDADGFIRAHTSKTMIGNPRRDAQSLHALETMEFASQMYEADDKKLIEYYRPVFYGAEKLGVVRIVYDMKQITRQARKKLMGFIRIYMLSCAVVFIIGVLIANLRGFAIVKRIQTVKQGAHELARGNLGYTMLENGSDEISFLTKTFNSMSHKLKELDVLKDDFIARVSHELKSPVSIIKGFTDKLSEEKSLTEKQENYVKQIRYGTNRLEHVVNQTLSLSRLKAGKMEFNFEKIDPAEIIPEIVEFFKERLKNKPISLIHQIEDNIPHIKADAESLSEVLANLLSNAIKFTKEGEICVWAKANTKYVKIGVQDTGIGINQNQLDTVFEKFGQIKENKQKMPDAKGTGLGLSIVKSIVESHHGKVHIESTVDKGSNIMFTIPIYKI
ncbi:MAG: HAMP domain-containing sensor histidine kinase [bacterium]